MSELAEAPTEALMKELVSRFTVGLVIGFHQHYVDEPPEGESHGTIVAMSAGPDFAIEGLVDKWAFHSRFGLTEEPDDES